jgi:phosphohistidine swiveling domain-containing protein
MRKYLKIEEMHPRDYSILGCTALFEKFVTIEAKNFFGRSYREIISVVKSGRYYYGEAVGDKTAIAKAFLRRVNRNEIDLEKTYKDFDRKASEYEKFILQPSKNLQIDSIKKLAYYYRYLIDVTYVAFSTLDEVETLQPRRRKSFEKWVTKSRLRAERLYKDGETIFVPKYLSWFTKQFAPTYSARLLNYLLYKEIVDFIDKGKKLPPIKELKQRSKLLYVSHYPWGEMEYASGKKAEKIIKERKLFESKISKGISELRGQVAYPGKAKAKISIIITKSELGKYKRGNIIVAAMTDPYYLPIMKQAPAFVTDEGGVLCHAAIVARELKKPCITGTKFATKIFKDGDLVEVDANKGIVRKL